MLLYTILYLEAFSSVLSRHLVGFRVLCVFFFFFVGGVLWGLGVRVWGWGLGIFRAQRNSLEHVNFSLKS